MMVSETQKRSCINQKKRKLEESPHSNMVVVADLDEQQISPKDNRKKRTKKKHSEGEGCRAGENKLNPESNSLPSCIDKLREELSCPICFEIFDGPKTTWCGHSFCGLCLSSALLQNGMKCPICRQFISLRLYNENTAIENTINLLFPQEMEARMVAKIKEWPESGKHIIFEQEEE